MTGEGIRKSLPNDTVTCPHAGCARPEPDEQAGKAGGMLRCPAVPGEHLKAFSLQVRLAALCLDEPFRARETEALIALPGEVLMDDWGLVERTLF